MKCLMKKLIPAVLGMTMLFTTAAFAQTSEEAKAVYNNMQAKSMTMSDGNAYGHFNLDLKAGEESANMTMDMNMLYKNMLQPDQMEFACQYIVGSDGQQIPMSMWYKDGYSYVDISGQKARSQVDMTAAMTAAMDPTLAAQTLDMFSDLSLKIEGNHYLLDYRMDEAKLNGMVKQVFSQAGLDSLFASGIDLNIHDVSGSYVINSDFIYESASVSMMIDITAGGETVSLVIDGEITQLNPGQPVEILFPNFSEFQDDGSL